MMRYQFGEEVIASALEKAVNDVLDDGYRTGDIMQAGMKQVGCIEMGEKLLEKL